LKEGGPAGGLLYKLLHAYVRLEGTDRDVFEAMHRLRNIPYTANFKAEIDQDWIRAYSFRPATAQEIIEELRIPVGDVYESLASMAERGIVKRRKD
jgi:predicted Rossmann fold nucleotide-binding protein DprA/Smf involved in DNA uptake